MPRFSAECDVGDNDIHRLDEVVAFGERQSSTGSKQE